MSLAGKRIAVTGAAGVLGGAVVAAVLANGAKVVAIGHAALPAVSAGVHTLVCGDLAEAGQARVAMADAAKLLGGLDGLVNVAGTFRFETLAKSSLDTFDLLYRVNLRTTAAVSQAALAQLADGGRIVNVGAAAALKAGAGLAAYSASKSGVLRLTEALAEELKPRRITVNAVLPSLFDTPANRKDMPKADFGKWTQPAEIAAVIVFLLSDAAAAVTGALIPVTGRV